MGEAIAQGFAATLRASSAAVSIQSMPPATARFNASSRVASSLRIRIPPTMPPPSTISEISRPVRPNLRLRMRDVSLIGVAQPLPKSSVMKVLALSPVPVSNTTVVSPGAMRRRSCSLSLCG